MRGSIHQGQIKTIHEDMNQISSTEKTSRAGEGGKFLRSIKKVLEMIQINML